ncbi:hypothetical protein LGK97_14045 [Clostridium sp. CS001]|uniref:hypothetical protein n=1 Tax=Clostridium sp. CS001 TaxID=2880648 RepID=UPI001CF344C7|nr:hypothetical protein [Clostridium sp. CS001]MCB2290864.1 hypothetical protein [Clostridium sp. CS001]
MAKNKVSISFSKEYLDIYAFLKTKHNISSYICELIRLDLGVSNEISDFESKVEAIFEKLLKNKQLSYNSDNMIENDENAPTSEDVDLIMNLF